MHRPAPEPSRPCLRARVAGRLGAQQPFRLGSRRIRNSAIAARIAAALRAEILKTPGASRSVAAPTPKADPSAWQNLWGALAAAETFAQIPVNCPCSRLPNLQ